MKPLKALFEQRDLVFLIAFAMVDVEGGMGLVRLACTSSQVRLWIVGPDERLIALWKFVCALDWGMEDGDRQLWLKARAAGMLQVGKIDDGAVPQLLRGDGFNVKIRFWKKMSTAAEVDAALKMAAKQRVLDEELVGSLVQCEVTAQKAEGMMETLRTYRPAYGGPPNPPVEELGATLVSLGLPDECLKVWATFDSDVFPNVFERLMAYSADWLSFGIVTLGSDGRTVCLYTCQDSD
jgi:hypothetical protein